MCIVLKSLLMRNWFMIFCGGFISKCCLRVWLRFLIGCIMRIFLYKEYMVGLMMSMFIGVWLLLMFLKSFLFLIIIFIFLNFIFICFMNSKRKNYRSVLMSLKSIGSIILMIGRSVSIGRFIGSIMSMLLMKVVFYGWLC